MLDVLYPEIRFNQFIDSLMERMKRIIIILIIVVVNFIISNLKNFNYLLLLI